MESPYILGFRLNPIETGICDGQNLFLLCHMTLFRPNFKIMHTPIHGHGCVCRCADAYAPSCPLVLAQVFNRPKAVLLKPKLLMGVANWMGERIKRNHVRQEHEDNSYEGKDDY